MNKKKVAILSIGLLMLSVSVTLVVIEGVSQQSNEQNNLVDKQTSSHSLTHLSPPLPPKIYVGPKPRPGGPACFEPIA